MPGTPLPRTPHRSSIGSINTPVSTPAPEDINRPASPFINILAQFATQTATSYRLDI